MHIQCSSWHSTSPYYHSIHLLSGLPLTRVLVVMNSVWTQVVVLQWTQTESVVHDMSYMLYLSHLNIIFHLQPEDITLIRDIRMHPQFLNSAHAHFERLHMRFLRVCVHSWPVYFLYTFITWTLMRIVPRVSALMLYDTLRIIALGFISI